MFNSIITRISSSVDNVVGHIVNRAIIAIPFVIAAGFATASASLWLNRQYGAEVGNLIMAGVFALCGLVCLAILSTSTKASAASGAATASPAAEADSSAHEGAKAPMSEADRELLMSALATATPLALPAVLRLLLRNLPLIAAVAAALFVSMAPSSDAQADEKGHPSV